VSAPRELRDNIIAAVRDISPSYVSKTVFWAPFIPAFFLEFAGLTICAAVASFLAYRLRAVPSRSLLAALVVSAIVALFGVGLLAPRAAVSDTAFARCIYAAWTLATATSVVSSSAISRRARRAAVKLAKLAKAAADVDASEPTTEADKAEEDAGMHAARQAATLAAEPPAPVRMLTGWAWVFVLAAAAEAGMRIAVGEWTFVAQHLVCLFGLLWAVAIDGPAAPAKWSLRWFYRQEIQGSGFGLTVVVSAVIAALFAQGKHFVRYLLPVWREWAAVTVENMADA
jgi:hypothetical protein